MTSRTPTNAMTVSNLFPVWDGDDGGGAHARGSAADQVRRMIAAPDEFDPAERPVQRSAYELLDGDDETWAEREEIGTDHELPQVDYDLLHRREIAKELLRARLIAIAERRERRSAYEIAFILLAAAVAVLLSAPPLVQVLLAAHGTQV